MTGAIYQCCDEARRARLRAWTGAEPLSGIDYVEVFAGATTLAPTEIVIAFVTPLPAATATLGPDNIRLSGGVRSPPPRVVAVAMEPPGPTATRCRVALAPGQPTDYSLYRLALVKGRGETAPPDFIDPRLAAVDVNFKIACASDGDCAPDCAPPPPASPVEAAFDYRARDWPALRRLMLDRMSALVPGFRRDDPLDLTTTLIEALAAEADRLSYRLDWIGTEAFLPTARARASVARHARLVGYRPGEGASARSFACFEATGATQPFDLPQGTPLLVRRAGAPAVIAASDWPALLALEPIVFETCRPIRVWPARGAMAFHTWSDDACAIPAGAVAATIVDPLRGGDGALAAGDLLLVRECASPDTGLTADARPERRHVVRLTRVEPVDDPLAGPGEDGKLVDVGWAEADALPFDLVIQARPAGGGLASATVRCADVCANVVLCDHGASLPPAPELNLPPAAMDQLRPRLDPPSPDGEGVWRPALDRADLSRGPASEDPAAPASRLLQVDPAEAEPRLRLLDAFGQWSARHDLLSSGAFSRDFVVEPGVDGRARLRFGDGVHGLSPPPAVAYAAEGRFGFGPGGNLGPDALGHVVVSDALARVAASTLRVVNPLPAVGGAAPETLAQTRLRAPLAFRRQERAVTPEDYAEMARRDPEVSAAFAVARWTGAFRTMIVYIDRKGGRPVDAAFRAATARRLERYRLMGVDVAVRGAIPAPLDVALFVCARPDALRAAVARAVRDALRPRRADGEAGFFHPDRFSFGDPLRLSALVAAAMAAPGVQSVEVTTFQRLGRKDHGERAAGVVRPHGPEILQLADDPNFPERGRLRIAVGEGR